MNDSKDEAGASVTNEPRDAAGKLSELIEKIKKTRKTRPDGSQNRIESLKLSESFEFIANIIGAGSYIDLINRFMSLCNSAKNEVYILDIKKESVRNSWIKQIDEILSVLKAENFDKPTGQIFDIHFSDSNIHALDVISERFINDSAYFSTKEDLSQAFTDASEAMDEFIKSGFVPNKIEKLLRIYLIQMRGIIDKYDVFGEDQFWEVYKQAFATFMQIHETVLRDGDDENASKINEHMRRMLNHLVLITSLGANFVTIGAVAIPLLAG